MRHELDNSLSVAAAHLRQEIQARPLYATSRAAVIRAALDQCRGRDVPAMRVLGGFSAVIERQIDALPAECHVPVGSKLLPFSIVNVLRGDVPAMRETVQGTLAREVSP